MNDNEFHCHFDENRSKSSSVLNDYEMKRLIINDQNDVDVDHLKMDEIMTVVVAVMTEKNN
jgi:hypothetical protein